MILRNTGRYSSVSLIETVCLSDLLRNGRNLREIVERAIRFVLPPHMVEVCKQRLAKGSLARDATARRARTLFDVAFMLFMRTRLVPQLGAGKMF